MQLYSLWAVITSTLYIVFGICRVLVFASVKPLFRPNAIFPVLQ